VGRFHPAHRDQWDRRARLRVVAPVGQGDPLARRTDGPRVGARRMGIGVDAPVIVAQRHQAEWVGSHEERQQR
jgi:hypothetical protein